MTLHFVGMPERLLREDGLVGEPEGSLGRRRAYGFVAAVPSARWPRPEVHT